MASELDDNGWTKAQAEVVDEVLATLQPALRDSNGLWTADYVRLRFRAHTPLAQCNGKEEEATAVATKAATDTTTKTTIGLGAGKGAG